MILAPYRKCVAAILATLLMRWLLRALGFDAIGLGLAGDIQTLVELGIDVVAAAVPGYLVWLLPNRRRG